MQRTPKLTARFLVRRLELGANEGPLGAVVTRAIRQLSLGPLPAPGDFETFLPSEPGLWSRQLGFGLWLLYSYDDHSVTMLNLIRLDE
jgi:Txe/YoeB family toxin of Txe-Axe toxin-antitoxin module